MQKNLRYNSILLFVFFLFLVATLAFFTSCSNADKVNVPSDKVRITIADGREYSAEKNIFEVERGSNLEIELEFLEGFVFDSCDYKDYTVYYKDRLSVVLILSNVRYPSFVNITTRTSAEGVYYHANGGEFTNVPEDYFLEWANAAEGRRQNTDTGENAVREGYTLTGWNTRSDGSGESVCLGGRITVPQGTIVDLYAQWSKWTSSEQFDYEEYQDGIKLTAYTGGYTETLTLPGEIDGKTVIAVDEGFARNTDINILIMPDTLKRIEKNAFVNCDIQTLYFFDTIEYVVNESFSGASIKTLHINARLAPRYLATSEVTEFADRMDRLILNRDKKKIIFFAGCSMSYGLNSQMVDEAFDGEYEIIDFGTMGETYAVAQLDCISRFLSEGDIFVHAPEPSAPYQLMYSYTMEPNVFLLCEGNFELISYMDMSDVSGVFTAFNIFNSIRMKLDGGSYLDDSGLHNLYGDINIARGTFGKDVSYDNYEYTYMLDYVTSSSISRLCDEYDNIAAMGATVMFSFAPVNYHGLTASAIEQKIWETFEREYRTGLSARGYSVISSAEDYIFEGRYFYDTDYHLNDTGVVLRTEQLIEDLKNAGVAA